MSDKTLSPIYASAPSSAFPDSDHPALRMLLDLSSGEPVPATDLVDAYSHNFRSLLQRLRGDDFGYWLISNTKNGYQLDWRHLSGSRKLDAEARRERKKELKGISYKEAKQGKDREPKALYEFMRASQEYFNLLGEAANDSSIDQPEKA
jgi:hypothetical protein